MKDIKIRKKSRIVFDTNIWISFLLGKHLKNLEDYIIKNEFLLIYSDLFSDEIFSTLQKPKLKKYFRKDDFSYIQSIFISFGEIINPTTIIELCRDKKDDFLLGLCIDGNANYLVTGDKDLLELKKIKRTKIITYNKFQQLCKQSNYQK